MSPLSNLLLPPTGKMRLVSSQDRQAPPAMMAHAVGPGEPGKMVEIPPGETYVIANIAGAGQIVRIWMTTLNLPGMPNFHDYGVLRFYWDGEDTPSVEVPFGAFFGVPWGKYVHYIAEPLSCTSGGYNCEFPMPFARGCRIEAVNQSPAPWPGLFFQVQYLEMDAQPSPLRFHAQWRRENPTTYRVPYRVLEAKGEGNFAGMHLFMQNAAKWLNPRQMAGKYKDTGSPLAAIFPEAFGMGILEGWERIYVDGETTPSVTGTGTEDYFNSGFYFSKGPYSAPYWGCTVRDYLQSRCAAYRFHVPDPIPFNKEIVVDMDHGYTNQVAGDYSSVAYWYQSEPHAAFPVLPLVEERLPESTRSNTVQFALFTSPLWVPAAWVGLKVLGRVFGKKR